MNHAGVSSNQFVREDFQKPAPLQRTIRGELTPKNPEIIGQDPRLLTLTLLALRKNGLGELTAWSFEWDGEKMKFNNLSTAYLEHADPKVFIEKLYRVIQTEEVAQLELEGGFKFVVETPTYPQVTRIMVKNGKIAYQASKYVWDETATVVPAPEVEN